MGILWNNAVKKCEFLSEFISCSDVIFLYNDIALKQLSILSMH